MAEATAQEKTEAPTVKRREDSRKEGMVAVSREVSSAALLGTFALYFVIAGQPTLESIEGLWHFSFANLVQEDFSIPFLTSRFRTVVMALLPVMLGIFGLIFIVGLLVSFLQAGLVFTPLKFQGKRINPLNGLKRIFSAQGAAELFKSLFKLGVIGYITYLTLRSEIRPILSLGGVSINDIFKFSFQLLASLFGRVAMALVILAVFDYLFQRWQLEKRMMMTKQELKEELKQTEGDPQLRARVRQLQREMSRARMMQNVPKADVIVTNPTHYAVALMYDREAMEAPRMVAKGADFLAERIKAIGRENDVPVVENAPLARELYTQVEIGQEIPENFFRAVAEILAYIYRLKGADVAPSA